MNQINHYKGQEKAIDVLIGVIYTYLLHTGQAVFDFCSLES